jgi:ureidoglycolate lyase
MVARTAAAEDPSMTPDDTGLAEFAHRPTLGARAVHETPLFEATSSSLEGFGRLIDDPGAFRVEITPWPAQGWRPIDPGTGDQGGVVEGLFEVGWRGETLVGRNHAVGAAYHFGWSRLPDDQEGNQSADRERALVWRANYHPDGGQLVWPATKGAAFFATLAPPGDDVRPESFVSFRVDGTRGLYIPPGAWHGPFVPEADQILLHDRQGRVHARVSVDFAREFGCYLAIPIRRP